MYRYIISFHQDNERHSALKSWLLPEIYTPRHSNCLSLVSLAFRYYQTIKCQGRLEFLRSLWFKHYSGEHLHFSRNWYLCNTEPQRESFEISRDFHQILKELQRQFLPTLVDWANNAGFSRDRHDLTDVRFTSTKNYAIARKNTVNQSHRLDDPEQGVENSAKYRRKMFPVESERETSSHWPKLLVELNMEIIEQFIEAHYDCQGRRSWHTSAVTFVISLQIHEFYVFGMGRWWYCGLWPVVWREMKRLAMWILEPPRLTAILGRYQSPTSVKDVLTYNIPPLQELEHFTDLRKKRLNSRRTAFRYQKI